MLSGTYGLHCPSDDTWASDTTPDGDPSVPVWSSLDDAKEWIARWPDYEVDTISVEEVLSGVFEWLNESDMCVALGLGRGAFVTFHPFSVAELMMRHEGKA